MYVSKGQRVEYISVVDWEEVGFWLTETVL